MYYSTNEPTPHCLFCKRLSGKLWFYVLSSSIGYNRWRSQARGAVNVPPHWQDLSTSTTVVHDFRVEPTHTRPRDIYWFLCLCVSVRGERAREWEFMWLFIRAIEFCPAQFGYRSVLRCKNMQHNITDADSQHHLLLNFHGIIRTGLKKYNKIRSCVVRLLLNIEQLHVVQS